MNETGGPAFPQQDDATGSAGMTLRDYFAAKAVEHYLDGGRLGPRDMEFEDYCATQAYMLADAMLKARAE